jgi:hypothetical protein
MGADDNLEIRQGYQSRRHLDHRVEEGPLQGFRSAKPIHRVPVSASSLGHVGLGSHSYINARRVPIFIPCVVPKEAIPVCPSSQRNLPSCGSSC